MLTFVNIEKHTGPARMGREYPRPPPNGNPPLSVSRFTQAHASAWRVKALIHRKKCPVCGRTFETNNKLYLYCSQDCRAEARRKQDRMRKKQQTAKNAVKRTAARLEIQNKRTAEAEAELLKAKQDFEKRCSAGDIHALLIREKSVNGITGRKYWELF